MQDYWIGIQVRVRAEDLEGAGKVGGEITSAIAMTNFVMDVITDEPVLREDDSWEEVDEETLDVGLTVGFKKLGLVTVPSTPESRFDLGSGQNVIFRLGLAIGLGG